MRYEDLYVAAVASSLPGRASAREAVRAGRYDEDEFEEAGYESVLVANGEAPPQMAVDAAREALGRSGVRPADVALVLHASVYHQGHDFWPSASYIQRHALPGCRAPALNVDQMSNGSLAATELAASYLAAHGSRAAALVTAADKFCAPGFDRWRSDTGIVYGDGGVAAVLSRRGGLARLLSIVTVGDSDLEQMHRGARPFSAEPWGGDGPHDVRARKRAYIAEVGLRETFERFAPALREVVQRSLDEAGIAQRDVARFILPNVGRTLLERDYVRPLGLDWSQTLWDWGRRTGHLGAGDQLAGLANLVERRSVKPGDYLALIGVGAGFTWTCAIVEIVSLTAATEDPTP
ncbi:MAG: ketoacyl-ACP synthase III family protein [Solirubrobacteraceae bacterium]